MKNIISSILILILFTTNSHAQQRLFTEKYGNTLNMGIGIGYFGYVGHSLPVLMFNYEFDVARNFTLAPFIGVYSYRNDYYWGDPGKPNGDPSYRFYSYRETTVPIGAKGTYYFDELFKANSNWDFYIGGSLGFLFRSVVWENDYRGDRNAYRNSSPLYLDAQIGTEYHLNQKTGLFLDLSTGISTFGLAIHM
jgi:hypothetical protein